MEAFQCRAGRDRDADPRAPGVARAAAAVEHHVRRQRACQRNGRGVEVNAPSRSFLIHPRRYSRSLLTDSTNAVLAAGALLAGLGSSLGTDTGAVILSSDIVAIEVVLQVRVRVRIWILCVLVL